MHSEATLKVLHSIAHHIDLALEFSRGLDCDAFVRDIKTIYAVTRCLEIISEASRRLPSDMKARHPHILWRAMAAAGNFYRHEYEDVTASRVWHVMASELERLRRAIETEFYPTR